MHTAKYNLHHPKSAAKLVGLLFLILIHNVYAVNNLTADQIKQINEKWVCKWCPYAKQSESKTQINAGLGYVSNDSFKHGDYTGLDEKGVYLIGDVDHVSRSGENATINVRGNELGTDARDVSVESIVNGKFNANVGYSELPHLNLDTARTPYSGDSNQQLPAGWTTGADTQSMPQLAGALHNADVYTKRKTFSLSGRYQHDEIISYELNFQRDTKEGTRSAGMVFGNSFALARSAILAIPVDYVTDQGGVRVNFIKQDCQLSAAYQFSRFDNNERSVRWENAFSQPASVTEGQAALEPDNIAWKAILTGACQASSKIQGNILISRGQMKQDEAYLPYTINGTLTPFALPASSLDGEINTIDFLAKMNAQFTDQLKLEVKYRHNEQDNDTSRNGYDYVVNDTSLSATPRANFPYSFRKILFSATGKYQINHHDVSLGIDHEKFDRNYQSVETTNENILRAAYRTDIVKNVDFQIQGIRSEREGDNYEVVSELTPPENVLMRKYNLADRERNQLAINASYYPEKSWQVSAYIEAAKDLYSNSDLGLLESIQKDYGVAFQYRVNKHISMNLDYAITIMESTQAGSSSFSAANWHAVNDDQIDVLHLGVNYDVIPENFSLLIEYSYAESEGNIKVSTDGPLPELTSTRHTFLVQGDYRLDKSSLLSAFYRYEDYDESDWANDNVSPDTIANVLSLGEVSSSYQVGVLGVAIRYDF